MDCVKLCFGGQQPGHYPSAVAYATQASEDAQEAVVRNHAEAQGHRDMVTRRALEVESSAMGTVFEVRGKHAERGPRGGPGP